MIDFCRGLCVFLMMYVHVSPGPTNSSIVFQSDTIPFYYLVVDWLGRASVAVLSVASGFLFYGSYRRRSLGGTIIDKATSLYIPMVAWNAVYLVALYTFHLLASRPASLLPRESLWENLSLLLALDGQPWNIPTGFLRDLFVSLVLLRVICPLLPRWGVFFLPLMLGLTLLDATSPIILRPSITLFALVGLFAASLGLKLREIAAPKFAVPLGALCLLAWLFVSHAASAWPETVPDVLKRATLVAAALLLAGWAVRHIERLDVGRVRSVLYVTYLSHGVTGGVLTLALLNTGLISNPTTYLIFFLAAPPIYLLVGLWLHVVIHRLPARAQIVLAGSKLPDIDWQEPFSQMDPFASGESRRSAER